MGIKEGTPHCSGRIAFKSSASKIKRMGAKVDSCNRKENHVIVRYVTFVKLVKCFSLKYHIIQGGMGLHEINQRVQKSKQDQV